VDPLFQDTLSESCCGISRITQRSSSKLSLKLSTSKLNENYSETAEEEYEHEEEENKARQSRYIDGYVGVNKKLIQKSRSVVSLVSLHMLHDDVANFREEIVDSIRRNSVLTDLSINDKVLRHSIDAEDQLIEALKAKSDEIAENYDNMDFNGEFCTENEANNENNEAGGYKISVDHNQNDNNGTNETRNRKLNQGNTVNFKNSDTDPSSVINDNNDNGTYSELYNPAIREVLKRRDSMLSDSGVDIDEIRKSVASRNSVSRSRRASVISTRKSIKREKIRRKSVAIPADFMAVFENESEDDFHVHSDDVVKDVVKNEGKPTKTRAKVCCVQ